MTSSITPAYFFITAVPTPIWGKVLRYCQSQPLGDGQYSHYCFEAQAGFTLDVKPYRAGWSKKWQIPAGTFFSERFHECSFSEIIEAVREGVLDGKVLTYPELLSGQDTMIVYFWPDENNGPQEGMRDGAYLHRKANELFEDLVANAMKDSLSSSDM